MDCAPLSMEFLKHWDRHFEFISLKSPDIIEETGNKLP